LSLSISDIDISQIQTKFTPPSGQDPKNIPYDPSQPLLGQIEASIASSLANFTIPSYHSPYLDCVLLHSPLPNKEQTLAAWEILESYVPNRIHALGISNCNLMQLQCLYESSTIKPSVVQNRFYPPTHFDVDVRAYCKEKGIVYQSFWTLTGNPALLQSSVVQAVAGQLYSLGVKEDTKQIALYALVLGLDDNICILNGTKDKDRMAGDLEGIRVLAKWIDNDDDDGEAPGGHGKEQLQWKAWMAEFWALIEHGEKMEGVGGQ
jgi:predicted oxidoreductase